MRASALFRRTSWAAIRTASTSPGATTITESAPRITKRLAYLAACALAFFIAASIAFGPAEAALGAHHTRGIILGTTDASIDIGLPNQDDVHFDMDPQPLAAIAEPSDIGALVPGAHAGVVATGHSSTLRAAGAVVVPDTLRFFQPGRISWDRPKGATFTFGTVVVRRVSRPGDVDVTIAYGRGRITVAMPKSTPVATLREGSREAFLSPQQVLVFSNAEADGISDHVDRIIVADGTLAVPI